MVQVWLCNLKWPDMELYTFWFGLILTRGDDGGDVVGRLNLHLKVLGQVVGDGERHAHGQQVLLPLQSKAEHLLFWFVSNSASLYAGC